MKKGFTFIEIIITVFIVVIIIVISSILVKSVIKNYEKNNNKLLIDNYANEVLYTKELFMKNNENNIPKYCNISDVYTYYDENFNNKYDSNELLCNKECDDDNCIRYFITNDDINNKDINCNKIIITENSLEISKCYIKNIEVKNYVYKIE